VPITSKYSLSFTTGAALITETLEIAQLKAKLQDWKSVRSFAIEQNVLQARTESTLKKIYGEVSRRLKKLSDQELDLLISTDELEQQQLIWLAICRHYNFINDFSVEVLSENFVNGRYEVSKEDYDVFFNAKAEWNSNLDSVSSQTKYKARQVLFKMMRECSLLNENKEIQTQRLSKKLKGILLSNDSGQINIFPGAEVS